MIVSPPTNGGLFLSGRITGEQYAAVQYDINLDLNYDAVMITPSFHWSPTLYDLFTQKDSVTPTDAGDVTVQDNALRNIAGISGYFLSSFDFRIWDIYSQPVIAKKQSPQFEIYVDGVYPNGFLKYHIGAGVAHESNGQYVETLQDFQHFREIDESLYNQIFASMGSNFFVLRGAYAITDWKSSIRQNILCLEYRCYFPGLADDLNITDIEIADGGLLAYDGIRLGVDHYEMSRSCTRLRLILPTNFTHDYLGKSKYVFPLRSGLEVSWISLNRAWPVFYTIKLGSGSSIAYYFVPSASLAFGITLPTTLSINSVSSELKSILTK
jgi:hypothetical protein